MDSIRNAVEQIERAQHGADVDLIRLFVDCTIAAIETSADGGAGRRPVEEWARDAIAAAGRGDVVLASRLLERFSRAPYLNDEREHASGVSRAAYSPYESEREHGAGAHDAEPEPNCIDCPNPLGRPTGHGMIRSYRINNAGDLSARCRRCLAAPSRLHVCLACGQQCWKCSSAGHNPRGEPLRVGPTRRIAVLCTKDATSGGKPAAAGFSPECPLCSDAVGWPADALASEAVRPLHEAGHPPGARLVRRADAWAVVAPPA